MSIIGIGLAAGTGERAYPLSRKGRTYFKSKAVIPFLGRYTIKWVLDDFKAQGVTEYHIITKGVENYDQIKGALGFGDKRGLKIGYSRIDDDDTNRGSGDALLTNLERFDVNNSALVFPVDSIYDLDLQAAYKFHKEKEAVVTIAGFYCSVRSIVGKYGFMVTDGGNMVTDFHEKPKDFEEIIKYYSNVNPSDIEHLTLIVNSGAYLFDSKKLREISNLDDVRKMRQKRLDIGGDLIPWLVEHDYKVSDFRIPRYGDLGTPYDYLETMKRCLSGEFESIERIGIGDVFDSGKRLFIDETSLEMKDGKTGKTLLKKIECGDVVLEKNVRIGSYVEVHPGVKLSNCNVSDDTILCDNVTIINSEINQRCLIGESASIEQSIIGLNTRVRSSKENSTKLSIGFVGDDSEIGEGSKISNSLIPPKGIVTPGQDVINVSL